MPDRQKLVLMSGAKGAVPDTQPDNGHSSADNQGSVSAFYDERYKEEQYFRYRAWLYRPFVNALVQKMDLRAGNSVLDLGCGQGFFSRLFADHGLRVTGVDLSMQAIRSAQAAFGSDNLKFERGDALSLPFNNAYDCVFARSLSPCNTSECSEVRAVTDRLLRYVKPGGVLVFCMPTKIGAGSGKSWTSLSPSLVKAYFAKYPASEVYFSLRIETLLLGDAAFCQPVTTLAAFLCRLTGIGGEIVAFVPRSPTGS